jgi:hypothetical protein
MSTGVFVFKKKTEQHCIVPSGFFVSAIPTPRRTGLLTAAVDIRNG